MNCSARGHTLLELLVALAVFAVVAAAGYNGLSQMSRARAVAELEATRLAELQHQVSRLEQDLAQAIDAPWRDADGRTRPALVGDETSLSLVQAGWFNPRQLPRSELQPLRWQWNGQQLQRITPLSDARALQQAAEKTGYAVTELAFSYLDRQGRWQAAWPAPGQAPGSDGLPRAVRLEGVLEGLGQVSRIVELPGVRR